MHRSPTHHVVAVWLAMMSLALAALGGGTTVAAQDGELTPVCIQAFETAPYVAWLTDAEIEEINQLEQDPAEPPVPEIVGYPDPETGSCATENGELKEYNPDVYTPVCVPSGPEGDGPLVVQWALTHYLIPESDVILADPETGACPGDEAADPAPGGEGDEGASTGDDDTSDGDVSTLPETGTGAVAADASEGAGAIGLLLVATALLGVASVMRRTRSN